jgi:hypothetical protein
MYGRSLSRSTSLRRHRMHAATAGAQKDDDRAGEHLALAGGPTVTSAATWRDEPSDWCEGMMRGTSGCLDISLVCWSTEVNSVSAY